MAGEVRRLALEEILTEDQIQHILKQAIGEDITWQIKWSEVKPAMDGLAGFLGDHWKAALQVDVDGEENKVNLFIKRISPDNKPKADFIYENNFYKREMFMYKVLEEICEDDKNPWGVKAYLYTDSIIVMPDLTLLGYSPRKFIEVLDSEHVFLTTTSIARFHAAFINYETSKSSDLKLPCNAIQEFGDILTDPSFCDSPFLRACPKLSRHLLKNFSTKAYDEIPDLESKLTQLFINACDSLKQYEDTLNVLLHRDLWVSNIMFKYKNNVPVNAILIDFQCIRYGPPTFDLMTFLYLTTDRRFRRQHEKDLFDHFYSTLIKNLNDDSKKKLIYLGYNKESFLDWCEKARMLGMVVALVLYPFILMDPKAAQKAFDDPETYDKHINEDRSEPVSAHANKCADYKRRNLEVNEEFIETYVLK